MITNKIFLAGLRDSSQKPGPMLLLLAALLQGAVATSVYDFEAVDIHGVNQPLSQYRGNVLVIINVASE